MDSISPVQVMNREIRQGSVYNDLTHRDWFYDDIVSQLDERVRSVCHSLKITA